MLLTRLLRPRTVGKEIRSGSTIRMMGIGLPTRRTFRREGTRGGRGLRMGDGLKNHDGSGMIYDGRRRGRRLYKMYAKSLNWLFCE